MQTRRWSIAWGWVALVAFVWCPSASASPPDESPDPLTDEQMGARSDPLLRLPKGAPETPAAWAEARNEIWLGLASGYAIATDELVSPRAHHGWTWGAPALRYAHVGRLNTHRVEIESGFAKLRAQPSFGYRTPIENAPASTIGTQLDELRLRYAYLRELLPGRRVSFRLGPAIDLHSHGGTWGVGVTGVPVYFRAIGLHARSELAVQPHRRHRLSLALSMPLFAWISRPPYAVYDDAEHAAAADSGPVRSFFRTLGYGRIESWNRYQSTTLELRYDLRIIRIIAVTFGVRATWLAEQLPRPLQMQDYRGVFGFVMVI